MSSLEKKNSVTKSKLSRRKFLGLLGATATGAVIFEACGVPEEELIVESPLDMPEDLVRGEDQWYATSCGISNYGESVLVRVMEGRAKKIAGNPDFPNSLGKQSVVSETNLQMLYHPDRITTPLYRKTKTGAHKPITWSSAISILEKGINESNGKSTLITRPLRGLNAGLIESFSNFNSMKHLKFDSINNGLMNKTMKSVFDQDRLPYFDIGNSDLIISFGLDFLGTWGPVQYKTKFGKLKQNHGKLISIEPRMSLTSANADKWICPIPGTEMIFALGVAKHILSDNLFSSADAEKEFKNLIGDIDLSTFTDEYVTQNTGLKVKDIEYVINKIKESKGKILFLGGGPLEGYKNSLESMSIVFALNYLTNSVGSKGGIIFNPETPIKEFKVSEEGPSINIIDSSYANNLQEWKEETLKWESGETNLLILRGSNIIHGIPYDLTNALDSIKLKVCFSSILDDTAEASDLILPEHNSLEDWGVDIPEPLMGYQTLLFQQPVVNSPTKGKESKPIYDSKSFYDVLISLSDPMLGIKNYKELIEKFTSKLYSTTTSNRQGSVIASNEKQFLEGVLSRGGLWNINTKINNYDYVSNQKLNSIQVSNNNVFNDLSNKEFYLVPFLSNTILDGITAASPWAQGIPDPITTIAWDTWAEINPKTAEKLNLEQGDIIELISSTGKIKLPVFPHPAVHPKVIGVPIGLGHKFSGRYAAGKGVNVLKLCHTKLDHSQTFSWAENTVKIKKTQDSKTIAKFEGTLPGGAVAVEPGVPILTVGPNQTADDALHEAHEEHMEETFKDKNIK